MNRDADGEASRPRPLSAGIWSLFSWLRRSDRSSSSESVSSVGSDRTAASFDFLSPIHYRLSAPPLVLSSQTPTDSYKKRVHERNIRRQRERDITLHRKYGLWREDGAGYDAFSLPSASKITELGNKQARCRRAASECLQRRAAYVPGKRRAPLPPTIISTTLPRYNKRKRPAPKPPAERAIVYKENLEINNNQLPMSFSSTSKLYELKSDRSKQDKQNKDKKLRPEKSFLKQIFESKRNSAIEISQIKLLPSISELDKQAAEIIETNKMLHSFENNNSIKCDDIKIERKILPSGNMWTCTKCLRRYNMTINSCVYCIPKIDTANAANIYTQTDLKGQNNALTNKRGVDDNEKKKLKEMLKEMKNSLPKKSKDDKLISSSESKKRDHSTEAPTLRIGSTIKNIGNYQNNVQLEKHSNFHESVITKTELTEDKCEKTEAINSHFTPKELFLNTKQPETKIHNKVEVISSITKLEQSIAQPNINNATKEIGVHEINKNQVKQKLAVVKDSHTNYPTDTELRAVNIGKNISIHAPLKISSLLNPIYFPKTTNEILVCASTSNTGKDVPVKVSEIDRDLTKSSPINKCRLQPEIVSQIIKKSIEEKEKRILQKEERKETHNFVPNNIGHSERRDLINQLELSIAKGDEKAAAEAAVKMAKLRLSCSVLSFSSQIIGGPSTSNAFTGHENKINLKLESNQSSTQHSEAHTSASENCNTQFVNNKKIVNTGKENESTINEKDKNTVFEDNAIQHTSRASDNNISKDEKVLISIWIEDKIAARGPIELNISRHAKIVDLRREAEASFGLANCLQRWIIGKTLCTDDSVPIISLAGSDFTAPFYLCLVQSDDRKSNNYEALKQNTSSHLVNNASGEFYTELIKLEQQALVTNSEKFECGVCMDDCATGNGAVLRECIHTFCRECLSDVVRHCEEPVVSCPAIGCPGALQDREIRALLTEEDYEKWLARGLAAAESGTRNTFHCRTTDCSGWAFCEPAVRRFPCPVCKHTNCVPCQAVHEGETCEQYQRKLRETVTAVENTGDEGTQALLKSLISRGEALECPECRAIITKKWGCDWVKCSACKTEICWITKGRRWGPGGRGDTSAGCRCGIDGKRCHPSCGYCH